MPASPVAILEEQLKNARHSVNEYANKLAKSEADVVSYRSWLESYEQQVRDFERAIRLLRGALPIDGRTLA